MAATGVLYEKLISSLVADDPEMADIVREFVVGLEQRAREFEAAYAAADWGRLRTLAHQLKGAGGSYGFPNLSRLGAEMEQAFQRRSSERVAEFLSELKLLTRAALAGL